MGGWACLQYRFFVDDARGQEVFSVSVLAETRSMIGGKSYDRASQRSETFPDLRLFFVS